MESYALLTLGAALSAAIATTCLTLAIFSVMQLIQVDKDVTHNDEVAQLPIFIKILLPFASNLSPIAKAPAFDQIRIRTQEQLMMAGLDQGVTAEQFVAVRILMGMVAGAFLLLFMFAGKLLLGIVLAMALLVYPPIWLKNAVARRHLQIMKALPNVLDLLTLSVEAGKDFLTALRDILTRRTRDALSIELSRTFQEIQLGKGRQEALRDLARRVQQPDLTSVINAIIQAEELGVSIGQLLRIQGDQLRGKRFSRAEKLANEAPVKIIFPVVMFIFPAVFIILMGPIIQQALKTINF